MSRQAFYYSEAPYMQALQGLYQALLSPEALVRVTGLPQTGKSVLCEKLMLYMQHKGYRVVYFRYAVESPDMLRTLLARELDLPIATNFARMLEDIPLNADQKPVILLFDDAHMLSDTTLLEVFRLVQVQSGATRKLHIVLCGEPLLDQRLARRPELKSLMLHISHSFTLQPMVATEMPGFVLAYMKKAGEPDLQLEPAATAYFYRATQGLPGAARALCSAIVAARRGSITVDPVGRAELVKLVRQLQETAAGALPSGTQSRESTQWVVLGPVAVVVVIASVGLLYQQLLGNREANQITLAPTAADAESTLESPFAETAAGDTVVTAEVISLPEVNPVGRDSVVASPPVTPLETPVQEEEQVVSDSDLVLVTAAQRGIADAEIVEPVFDDVTAVDDVIGPSVPAAESLAVVSPSPPPGPVPTAVDPVPPAIALPVANATPDTTEPVPVPSGDTISGLDAASAEPVESIAAEAPLTDAAAAERDVASWMVAWQAQRLEEYFAHYHANFVPRYHSSRQRWQQDRSRVIGNAMSITLAMTEFEILVSSPERMEVQFWLDYTSPTYADSTQKKLILEKQDGRWLILEEINLQVRS